MKISEDVLRVGDRGDRVWGTACCFRHMILLERAGRPLQHEVGGQGRPAGDCGGKEAADGVLAPSWVAKSPQSSAPHPFDS